jgi:hypothetical protein
MNRIFTKVSVVALALIFSVFLAAEALGRAWPSPGDYVANWVFHPENSEGVHDLRAVVLVHIGTNSICCFATFCAIYLLVIRRQRKNQDRQ